MSCSGNSCSKFLSSKTRGKLFFFFLAAAVLFIFFLKAVFLLARYGLSGRANSCEQRAANNTGSSNVSHEFILTIVVYGILSVLRFLEYAVLSFRFYRFLFVQNEVNVHKCLTKHSRRYFYLLIFSIIMFPYFLLGIVIPSLGVYQEIEHSARLEECYSHYPQIYITYCVINLFRYMSAYSVRILLVFTTLAISKFWFPDYEVPAHTSSGHVQCDLDATLDYIVVSRLNPNSETRSQDNKISDESENEDNLSSSDIPPEIGGCGNIQAKLEVKAYKNWKAVSEDFHQRTMAYRSIGRQVMLIQDLFQTWFIIPWIVYLMASSLKTYNILRPWNLDDDGNSPPSNIPHLYYLLYNVNQFITLLLPFLCAKKINTYHQKYYNTMRESQLKKFWDNPDQLSLARQLNIEKEDNYDFVPRIVLTKISINISSPLYIILLLAGLFLSVSKSLLR